MLNIISGRTELILAWNGSLVVCDKSETMLIVGLFPDSFKCLPSAVIHLAYHILFTCYIHTVQYSLNVWFWWFIVGANSL